MPLYYIALILFKIINKLKFAILTIIALIREQMTIIQESFTDTLV
jgi:hypothetical protein